MSARRAPAPDGQSWRETLLQRILVAVTPIVVAAVVMALLGTTGRNRLTFLLIVPLMVLQVVALFKPRWPYRLRAWISIAPLWFGAVLAYYLTGFKGNASVVAACAVVLSGLLFDRRTMALVLGSLTIAPIAVGTAMVTGALGVDDVVDLSTAHAMPWIRTTFVAFAIWSVLGLAITFVVQRIEGELAKTKQALVDLRAEEARRVRAEGERRAAEDAALQAQKMELVGRLAAGVAHDFNNLLGVVAGWTDLSLDDAASGTDRRQAKEALDAVVQQGKALTRQLLALSRRDARVVTRVVLDRTMRSGVSTLSRVLPTGVTLTFEAGPSVHVDADETELQQVLFNLVLNARDALPESGGTIRVTTGVADVKASLEIVGGTLDAGRYATLCVKDDGSGIDSTLRQQIFELFFTTKPIGLGTGLGLATVLRIAQLSSGGITLDSAPHSGSAFTLYLPIAG